MNDVNDNDKKLRHNNNNKNNPICKAPECQKTSVALDSVRRRPLRLQGHSRSLMLVPLDSTIRALILSWTNFQLLHMQYWSNSFTKGVTLVNALVLGNLCEYRYKSYIAKIDFGLHICCKQYGPVFNHFDVICPQSYRISVK